MDAPIDLLTWGGASALALLLTQLLKYRMPEGYRCPPLVCVLVADLQGHVVRRLPSVRDRLEAHHRMRCRSPLGGRPAHRQDS